jgi:3-oxoacyl-[acyl-carrier-protein] synthase II
MSERVAITGVGLVTPIGIGLKNFAESLRAGRSGVGPITAFDATGCDTRIAAEIDDRLLQAERYVRPPKHLKLMSRPCIFAAVASRLAHSEAQLSDTDVDPDRMGVCLGAGGMGITDLDLLRGQAEASIVAAADAGTRDWDVASFSRTYVERTNPLNMLRGLPNLASAHVAIQHGARGPNSTIATACTSGTQAIGDALRILRAGAADVMLAGGSDAMINPIGVLGFSMLRTLSERNAEPERASRPFERDRDGFVIGEGAAILVLEREAFARARGARVLAELAGYAATCDAYRITDERPDASGAQRAITACIRDAGATPADVGYINAHGTGTRMNDAIETLAIKQALGTHATQVPVSSIKSMQGHLLAAAGAVEAAACIVTLTLGFLPPTINYEAPDPDCDLDYVPNTSRTASVSAALSNSFGFGGQNACLLIRQW